MSITNEGYNFINNYMDFFNFFNKAEELDKKIIKKLYSDVYHSNIFAKSFVKTVHKESIEISESNKHIIDELNISRFTSFTSSHVLKEMRNIKKLIRYSFSINNIEYQLVFLVLNNGDERIIDNKLKTYLRNIHFLTKYMDSKMKTLKIVILYSTEKKEKNKDKKTLGPNNVNTGVTRSCSINGSIFLYRQEELIKVFIHELIHAKCIDFSNINANIETLNIVKEMFNINSDFIISESYSEFWANIVNTLFVALDVSKSGFEDFYDNFTILHIIEKIFSLHQIVSVLNYMDLTYEDIVENNNLSKYSEDTNVFAYYILKTIWLYFGNDYLLFMKKNNSNLLNSNNDTKYIRSLIIKTKKYYKHKKFLSMIAKMEKKFNRKTKRDSLIENSLRMTILEQK